MKAKLNYQPATDEFDLYVFDKYPDGTRIFFHNMTITKLKPFERITPLIDSSNQYGFSREFCQAILDAAWENGMRPAEFKDIQNETTAIKYHLEDMRKLVFKNK